MIKSGLKILYGVVLLLTGIVFALTGSFLRSTLSTTGNLLEWAIIFWYTLAVSMGVLGIWIAIDAYSNKNSW